MGGRTPYALLLLALLGCSRSTDIWVEDLEVRPATVADNPMLVMPPPEVEAELRRRLEARRPFKLASAERSPPGDVRPWRFELEIAFTREALKEGRDGVYSEVGARLELRRRDETGDDHRFEVFGLGSAKVEKDKSRPAMREALGLALDQLVASAELQLRALDKPTDKLQEDLKSEDPRLRAFALEALVARRDPSALEPLLRKLESDDPDELRRVIGHLVELKDPRAATVMIDVARGKDPAFQRELLFALGALGGEEAEAYLFTVAQGHDNSALRDAAERALAELNRPTRVSREKMK